MVAFFIIDFIIYWRAGVQDYKIKELKNYSITELHDYRIKALHD